MKIIVLVKKKISLTFQYDLLDAKESRADFTTKRFESFITFN